ncbi:hypothetical protein PspR76_24005 [Pseudomonas sp. R76]|nr:hypothetical protein PspR76_24005 [Pseudomonas sp. R76]
MTDASFILTPTELVQRWRNRVSVRTLANWRSNSNGPRYVKISGRVGYKLADVAAWEGKRTVGGTGDYRS